MSLVGRDCLRPVLDARVPGPEVWIGAIGPNFRLFRVMIAQSGPVISGRFHIVLCCYLGHPDPEQIENHTRLFSADERAPRPHTSA